MLGFSPFEETDEKEAIRRVTFYSLWWNANMKMNVRFRVGDCQDMEKKEKDRVHPVNVASKLLNLILKCSKLFIFQCLISGSV